MLIEAPRNVISTFRFEGGIIIQLLIDKKKKQVASHQRRIVCHVHDPIHVTIVITEDLFLWYLSNLTIGNACCCVRLRMILVSNFSLHVEI